MRDFYLLLNTAVAIALLALGIVTLINNRKPIVNKFFFLFTLCVGVWMITAAVSNDTRNTAQVSLFCNYLVFGFSYFTSYFLLWFSILVTESRRYAHILKVATIPLVMVGIISATPLVVAGVESDGNVYGVTFGPLVALYAIILILQLVLAILVIARGRRLAKGRKKAQVSSIMWALIVAVPVLLLTQFIAPASIGFFGVTDVGLLIMVLPVYSLYVSVVRHGLFDIRIVAVRALTYVFSLATLAGIYYLLAYVLSNVLLAGRIEAASFSPLSIGIAIALAFTFQPIRRFFDRVTNAFFFRDSYDVNQFFARITERLSRTSELYGLLHYTAEEVSATLKSDFGAMAIYHKHGRPIFVATNKQTAMSALDLRALSEFVGKKEDAIIMTSALELPEERPIRRLLVSYRIALALPILIEDDVQGYLFLGEHKSSQYTKRDTSALETIADELAIAIHNALSLHEVRRLNATLQQRIDNATAELRRSNAQLQRLDEAKDEFISMASHQLRTPLTSVKGYISMLSEGDAGKVNSQQEHLLNEAFMSSERMVRLINDFLNVSRLQTGKFTLDRRPTDLSRVVEEEIEALRPNAEARQLKFTVSVPKGLPLLNVDEGKIRQVVMNFADNALYYSPEGSTIRVGLKKEGDEVIFTVKDAGIGVPNSEKAKLFEKFFRAENAKRQRPDGTGIGLYLAKKVVDAHKGNIVFESVEKKGSTFGFRLSISATNKD